MADERKEREAPPPTQHASGNKPFPWSGVCVIEPYIPKRQTRDPQTGDVRTELTGRCGQLQFPPTKDTVRGRWTRNDLLGNELSSEGIERFPEIIQGQHIWLSGRERRGRIYDPISEHTLSDITRAAVKIVREKYTTVAAREYTELSDTKLKTWLYWMRRFVDQTVALLIEGVLPTLDEIKALPGKTEIGAYFDSTRVRRFLEDPEPVEVR